MVGSLSAFCQSKNFSEASLHYTIEAISLNGDSTLIKPLKGASLEVYLKGTHSRVDMHTSMGDEAAIYDARTGKGFILKDYGGQKLLITLDRSNWEEMNRLFFNLDFKIDEAIVSTGEFVTKKASVYTPEGIQFTVYFASDLVPVNRTYKYAFAKLNGIPVKYEMTAGNTKFIYTLLKVDEEIVSTHIFNLPATGYRTITYNENQKMIEK